MNWKLVATGVVLIGLSTANAVMDYKASLRRKKEEAIQKERERQDLADKIAKAVAEELKKDA